MAFSAVKASRTLCVNQSLHGRNDTDPRTIGTQFDMHSDGNLLCVSWIVPVRQRDEMRHNIRNERNDTIRLEDSTVGVCRMSKELHHTCKKKNKTRCVCGFYQARTKRKH